MSVYLGVDFHARTQTVCWCDTADRLIHRRTLDHPQDDVRGFYTQFPAPAVVGLEATGYARWFHHGSPSAVLNRPGAFSFQKFLASNAFRINTYKSV
jgi:hypothetical protein